MDTSLLDEDPPDLTLRYKLQVSPEAPETKGKWETVASFRTILDAIRGCSSCYEGVRIFLDQSGVENRPVEDFIRHRVFDSEKCSILFTENEEGGVNFDKSVFPEKEGSAEED